MYIAGNIRSLKGVKDVMSGIPLGAGLERRDIFGHWDCSVLRPYASTFLCVCLWFPCNINLQVQFQERPNRTFSALSLSYSP